MLIFFISVFKRYCGLENCGVKMKKYYFFFGEGSQVNQLLCAILINIPMFAYGACVGWISPMTLLLQSENSPRGTPLTDAEISWMAAAGYLTCVPANFTMSYIGDRIGRKITLLIISSLIALCWITMLSSFEIWAFITARVLFGMAMGGCYVICPLYTKEISQDSIRGFLGTLVTLFHTSGNLFLYIIGDLLNYNTILWICLAMPVFHLILFMMMPESPSFLIKKGNFEESARVLAWLRCRTEDDIVIKDELEALRREQKKDEESNRFVFKSIFTNKILFRAFRIAMLVAWAREVCGAIPVLNFAGEIFSMAGSGLVLTPNQQAMMLGAVQVAGSVLSSSLVEKTGRKFLLFTTSLISGLSMCALAAWFLAKEYQVFAPGWIPITTLCLCIFCDSLGLLPVSIVVTGEIFSCKYRGTVLAATMTAASFSDFLQILFFKPLANAVGVYAAFFFFGGVCLLAALYVLMVIPETKNKTLDQIYDSLKTKKEKLLEANSKETEKEEYY